MPEFFTVASQKLLQKDLKIGPFLDGLSLSPILLFDKHNCSKLPLAINIYISNPNPGTHIGERRFRTSSLYVLPFSFIGKGNLDLDV